LSPRDDKAIHALSANVISTLATVTELDDLDFNKIASEEHEETAVRLWQGMFSRIDQAEATLNGEYVAVVDPRSSLGRADCYLGPWRK